MQYNISQQAKRAKEEKVNQVTHYHYKGYSLEEVDGGFSIEALVNDHGLCFLTTVSTADTLEEARKWINEQIKKEA